MRKDLKLVLMVLSLCLTISITSAEVQINPENYQSLNYDESLTITGSAQGENVNYISIKSTDGNSAETNYNCDSSCSTSYETGSFDYGIEKNYVVEAKVNGEVKTSDQLTIEWKESPADASIESLDVTPSSSKNLDLGESLTITGSAQGENIDYIKIERISDGDSNQNYNCDTSCSESYTTSISYQETEREYKVYVKAGEDSREETVTVRWRSENEDDKKDETHDSEDPEADLELDPTYAEIGEQISFDASGSTDNQQIDRYEFDFDDDGQPDEINYFNGEVTESFDDSYRGDVVVEVFDESGNSDTISEYYSVSPKEDRDEDNEDARRDGDLEVTVRDDEGDRLEGAYVRVRNGDYESEYTGSRGEADFYNLHTGEYDLYVRCEGESESEDIDVDEGNNYETVRLDFDSSDNECDGDREDDEDERDGELSVNVEDESGSSLDARVSVDGQVEYTGTDGRSNFGSLPREEVEVRVSKNGYDSEYKDVDLEDDRVQTIDVTLSESETRDADEEVCRITQSSLHFGLEDYTIDRGDSTDARLEIFNPGERDQDVEVKFKLSRNVVESRTVTVPGYDSRIVSESISPKRDQFVTAEVSTTGSPCGFQSFDDMTREITVLSDSSDEASLDVEVYNRDNDPVRDARVRVDGPEDMTRYTDYQGEAGFKLSEGDYDVTVSHPRYNSETRSVELLPSDEEELEFRLERSNSYDEDDGTLDITVLDNDGDWIEDAHVRVENGEYYTKRTDRYGFTGFRLEEDRYDITVTHPDYGETEYDSVYINEDELESRTFRLNRYNDEEGIQITNVDYPDTVCQGHTLSIDYTVRNNEDYDESAQTTARGFNSNIITNTYVIESGDSVSGTLRFTNIQGSGHEEFQIRVQNGDSDTVYRTVNVQDCTDTTSQNQDPSGVSMKLSYPIAPNQAVVGDTIKVSGFVDGVTGRTNVDIDVDGNSKASVSTQPDGYYQTYIRVDSVGSKTVRVAAGGYSSSRQIEVLPTTTVGAVDAPRKVFEGENYQICSEVSSQIEPKVILVRDGEVIESKYASGEVCFDVKAADPGTHIYEVTAIVPGQSRTARTSVEVLETDVEATSFPSQVVSVESGSSLVKVELYNTHDGLKRYDLNLEGLPDSWLSQSRKQVILDKGERETVYFYLTPRDEGSYDPELVVNSGNQQVYRQSLNLTVGGSKEKPRKSFIEKLSSLLSF